MPFQFDTPQRLWPILIGLFMRPDLILAYSNFSVELLIGNQAKGRAEIYSLSFICDKTCDPEPIDKTKLLWASQNVSYISEVKSVMYKGVAAILATSRNGADVISYPSDYLLFREEICGNGIGTHSAEILPDGTVVVVGTYDIYFLKQSKSVCQLRNETMSYPIQFGHGITYDKKRNKLYVLGYLKLEVFDLNNPSGIAIRENPVSLENFYYSPDHNEDVHLADGGHDLYPIEGFEDNLFLTTGERVYVYNVSSGAISYHQLYYYLPSQNGVKSDLSVRLKGGVKSISRDSRYLLNIIHAAPWFRVSINCVNFRVHSASVVLNFP